MEFMFEYRVNLLWVLLRFHRVSKHISAQDINVSKLSGSVVDKVGQSILYATIFYVKMLRVLPLRVNHIYI